MQSKSKWFKSEVMQVSDVEEIKSDCAFLTSLCNKDVQKDMIKTLHEERRLLFEAFARDQAILDCNLDGGMSSGEAIQDYKEKHAEKSAELLAINELLAILKSF